MIQSNMFLGIIPVIGIINAWHIKAQEVWHLNMPMVLIEIIYYWFNMKFTDPGSFLLVWLIAECENGDQMSAHLLAWNIRTWAELQEDLSWGKYSSWKHQDVRFG